MAGLREETDMSLFGANPKEVIRDPHDPYGHYKRENGIYRFLAEPGASEEWLRDWVTVRIKNNSSSPFLKIGDVVDINARITKDHLFKIFGILISWDDKIDGYDWSFYPNLEDTLAQRVLRDFPQNGNTFPLRLDWARIRMTQTKTAAEWENRRLQSLFDKKRTQNGRT